MSISPGIATSGDDAEFPAEPESESPVPVSDAPVLTEVLPQLLERMLKSSALTR